jgi:hypothetical protein
VLIAVGAVVYVKSRSTNAAYAQATFSTVSGGASSPGNSTAEPRFV